MRAPEEVPVTISCRLWLISLLVRWALPGIKIAASRRGEPRDRACFADREVAGAASQYPPIHREETEPTPEGTPLLK